MKAPARKRKIDMTNILKALPTNEIAPISPPKVTRERRPPSRLSYKVLGGATSRPVSAKKAKSGTKPASPNMFKNARRMSSPNSPSKPSPPVMGAMPRLTMRPKTAPVKFTRAQKDNLLKNIANVTAKVKSLKISA